MANYYRVLTTPSSLLFGTLAAVLTALAMSIVGAIAMPSGASAQWWSSPYGYSGPRYRQNRYYLKKRRARRARSRTPRRRKQSYAKTIRKPVGEVMLLVSINKQRIYVHDKKGLVAEAPISTGRRGYATPKGIFTILQKNKRHYSNLYAGAPMPNMQRITWSGVALHGGALPGYPASHGCIRLPYSFAKSLFGMTSMHGRVIVAGDPIQPKTIQHARLFQPLPGDGSQTTTEANAAQSEVITVAEAKPKSRIDSDLGTVIGVGTAQAKDVARLNDAERLQRANKYRRKRLEKRTRISKELAAAENTYDLFHVDAKRVADEWKVAKVALSEGREEVTKRKKAAKEAEQGADAAHRKLKDFDRKYRNVSRRQTADKLHNLAELERALDSRTLDAEDGARDARKHLFAAERRIAGLESNVALVAKTLEIAQAKLAPVKKRIADAKAAEAKYLEEEKQRAKPISVFISGKTGRLYARQGWFPVLDVPVKIKDPDVALGTHLFTAIAAKDNSPDVEWNVVTVENGRDVSTGNSRSRYAKYYGKKSNLRPHRSTPHPARLALNRVEIPDDARDKIEDLMKAGSSIIVSDYPKSNETGKHTDFIILTR